MAATASASGATPLPPETWPAWSVVGFSFSNKNTDPELEVMRNGKRFVLRLSADNLSASPRLKDRYLFFLQVAENYELDGFTVEDFWDWAAEPLLPLFRDTHTPQQLTLQDFFEPETLVYTLRAVSDELVAEPCSEGSHVEPRFGVPLDDQVCTPWICFSPSQVQTCQENAAGPPSQTPRKVLLPDGSFAFLKLVHNSDERSLKKELHTYRQIDQARLDDAVRVPRLRGLVRDGSGLVLGLLITYIDCGHTTLSCAVKPETPMTLRQEWVAQLKEIISQLHSAGIVWGDAKPDNVLVDRNQLVWVIDFGGGYTEGWVPKTSAGTLQGDRLALDKMVGFVCEGLCVNEKAD